MSVTGIPRSRIAHFKIIWPSGKQDKSIPLMERAEWNLITALFPVNERIKFLKDGNLETLLSFIPKVKDLSSFKILPWFWLLLKGGRILFLKFQMGAMSTSTIRRPSTAEGVACCCLKMQRILFTLGKERAFAGST